MDLGSVVEVWNPLALCRGLGRGSDGTWAVCLLSLVWSGGGRSPPGSLFGISLKAPRSLSHVHRLEAGEQFATAPFLFSPGRLTAEPVLRPSSIPHILLGTVSLSPRGGVGPALPRASGFSSPDHSASGPEGWSVGSRREGDCLLLIFQGLPPEDVLQPLALWQQPDPGQVTQLVD